MNTTSPQTDPLFCDPYAELPDERLHRTTIVTDKADWAFLSGIHGRKGTLQCTIYILLKRTIEQLKLKGITDYDPERFESAVAGATVTLGGTDPVRGGTGGTSPNAEPKPKTLTRDDGHRVAGVVQQSPCGVDESRDVPSAHSATDVQKGKVRVGRKTSKH